MFQSEKLEYQPTYHQLDTAVKQQNIVVTPELNLWQNIWVRMN
jgi:hypothetical protein